MLGNEAVARAAYESGVTVATAYPGTPSTEITENIAKYKEIYCEWSPNEKVALEVAIGAAIGGARAICSMKHVGLNVAADPLFTASYTGINGGLVVMVADDPGMHSSQNEQDSRYYGLSAKLPVLEPSDSQECLDFVKQAFSISEEFDTPVIVRLTTRTAHSRSIVRTSERQEAPLKDYVKNPGKYVMMPAMARSRLIEVEKRMRLLEQYSETTGLNRVIYPKTGNADGLKGTQSISSEMRSGDECAREKPKFGVITSGISYNYTMEAGVDAPVLKLGMTHPLPAGLIGKFSEGLEEVYIIEELSPFIEDYAKKIGINAVGKELLPAVGELTAAQVREKVKGRIDQKFGAENTTEAAAVVEQPKPVLPQRPPVLCPGCPHRGVFYVLKKMKLNVTGDIGCYTLGALPPLEAIDTCVCMGASISVAHGMDKARGRDFSKKTVAVIGDSTFIHSGITPLIDIVYNKGTTTTLILDNDITGMTGHQQNPSTGYTIRDEETVKTDLVKLCEALGVPSVRMADPFDVVGLERILKEELTKDCASVVVIKRPCALLKSYMPEAEVRIDPDKCTSCKQCMKISCAAIVDKDGKMTINDALCVRCGLCSRICKFDAIVKGGQ
jgi:indolepyruvate ferredoxin oxidoreductase alpha subunit